MIYSVPCPFSNSIFCHLIENSKRWSFLARSQKQSKLSQIYFSIINSITNNKQDPNTGYYLRTVQNVYLKSYKFEMTVYLERTDANN